MASTIGNAFKLNADGDLSLKETDDGLTFDIIEDANEVAQAIVIRLRTRRGEDPISPEVGLPVPDIVGTFRPALLRNVIRSELQKEGRIRTVERVSVEFETDERRFTRTVSAFAKVRLVNREFVNIFEVF